MREHVVLAAEGYPRPLRIALDAVEVVGLDALGGAAHGAPAARAGEHLLSPP